MKKIIKILLGAWLAVGTVGVCGVLLCHWLSALGVSMNSSYIRFPLGEVSSMTMDTKGCLWVYSTDLCRLQIFDQEGRFLKGWFVSSASPEPSTSGMHIDPNGHIHLILISDDHYIFDAVGNLLNHSKEEGIWKKFDSEDSSYAQYTDDKGNTYIKRGGIIHPRIAKINPTGEETIMISEAFYTLPFRGKYSALFFFGIPVTIIVVTILWSRRKRKKQNIESAEATPVS